MKNCSNITDELIQKLREIYDDKEFIMGVLTYADNDADRKIILDFINCGEDVDDETVTVLAMNLNDRNNN